MTKSGFLRFREKLQIMKPSTLIRKSESTAVSTALAHDCFQETCERNVWCLYNKTKCNVDLVVTT